MDSQDEASEAGASAPASDAGFVFSRWREISSFVGQLGLRHGEPDREDQIICGGLQEARAKEGARRGRRMTGGRE